MSQSYTIQPGDTLLQIAIDQQVDYTALLAANDKYQANPDYIRAGDILILPESEIVESIEPTYSVEPPVYGPECESEGEIISQPECKAIEVHDVVFVTGDSPTEYYCLSADHQEKIKKEVKCTDQLIQGYKQLLDDAPTDADLDPKKIEEHALRKKAWLEDAVYAGAIKVDSQKQNAGVAQERSKESPPTQHYISSKITELKQRKAIVSNYVKDSDEISAVILRNRVIKSIDSEISHWERQFNKPSSTATSNKQSIDLNNFNTKTLQTKPPRRHVVEVWLVSENRLVYVRSDFFEKAKLRWKKNPVKTELLKALSARDWQKFKQAVVTDIKKGFDDSVTAGKIDAVFAEWKGDWKYHEWKASQEFHNDEGEVVFAATQEAQLFRFAAQASVKSELELTKGKIDIGVGAEASFALAEGAVGVKRYYPSENGYSVELSYTDANKKPAVYPFGSFRANASLMLSCFVGGMTNGRVSISNQAKPNPNPGHEILFSPTISMDKMPSGGVGVKAEIFGGAQAGGQLEGAMEWKAPPDIALDKVFDFETLAKVSANGNVAFGAGAGLDFQLNYDKDEHIFIFSCSGRLVFGPGASGGFGTVIQFDQLWQLCVIIFKGLQAIDYRIMDNIGEPMYNYLVQSSYAAFVADFVSDPKNALKEVISDSQNKVSIWWKDRLENWNDKVGLQIEAETLAENIIKSVTIDGSFNSEEVSMQELPPETVGIMLNTLVSTFYFSFEEKQETAIYILFVSMVKTWRRLEEVLVRLNSEGTKQNGEKVIFDNLRRINAILDGEQQLNFNNWVIKLAELDKMNIYNYKNMKPFTPKTGAMFRAKRIIIEEQINNLNNNNGSYYV